MTVEKFLGVVDYVALEIFLLAVMRVAPDAQLSDAGLAFGTLFPSDFGTFVASDVDIARGEEGYDFGENIVDECENAVVAGAEHVVRDAPHGPHLIGPSGTPEMGVGGKCGLHVAGKVYLGYDGDVSVGGIVDHFCS